MGIASAKPKTGRKDNLRLEEVVELMEWQPDELSRFRLIGDQILGVKRHWIKIYAGKERKEIKIPRYCLAHNPVNEDEPTGQECPYCTLSHGGSDTNATASTEFFYLMNAIDREEQENEPAKKASPTKKEAKTGFKDKTSKTWTPVKVVRLPSSVARRIQELKDLNVKKDKATGKSKSYDLDHPKFGCDIMVRYKPKASGTDKYSTDKGDRTPLTDEEKEYLTYNLTPEILTLTGLMTEKEAKEDFKRNEYVGGDMEEDEDDDAYSLGKKKSKKKKKKSSDDDAPKKKKKKKSSDEDDAPKKKKKKSSDDDAPKKKKKKKKGDIPF
jgi:hypothetical protein